MRDALGGTVTIVIIVFFIVLALGYLAFNVNYTKAFRMKDKIITLYEDYEGECNQRCESAIRAYARKIGYSTDRSLKCPSTKGFVYKAVDSLYCVAPADFSVKSDVKGDSRKKVYYKIITKINLQIPVISNIFDFRFFYISGETKTFVK